ncbi:iron-containing alcohol dehydrogenase [Chloroflexota bacterium]
MINKQIMQFPIFYANAVPRIAFGWGVHETVADECKAAKIKKALIVSTGLKGTGIVDEIKQILNYHGISTEVYDKVTTNPKDYQVMEAYQVFKDGECDGVVSVGGGSSHDCGKGVRAVAANGGKHVIDFTVFLDEPWMEKLKEFNPSVIPQVSVNTTCGTGAEITPFAAITDTKERAKKMVRTANIAPVVSLDDPLLIRTMPKNIAAFTGFDALAHGFESSVTKVLSPFAVGLLLRGTKQISQNIREFAYNRMDHKACENMLIAEKTISIGMCLGGGAGIVHGLGHQLGALTDCLHGLSNGVLALAGERYNQPACVEKLARLAKAMGADTTGKTKVQASDMWFDKMERLLDDLEIKPGHLNEQFGLQHKDLEHIVKIYSNDLCQLGNPRDFNYDETIQILESIM